MHLFCSVLQSSTVLGSVGSHLESGARARKNVSAARQCSVVGLRYFNLITFPNLFDDIYSVKFNNSVDYLCFSGDLVGGNS